MTDALARITAIVAGTDTTTDDTDDRDALAQEVAELTDERDGLAAEVAELQRLLIRIGRDEDKARERLDTIRSLVGTLADAMDASLDD